MLQLCLALILLAFVIAVPATALARAMGRRLNAMDGAGVAGQVKAAPRRVPNTGGLGIFAGVLLPVLGGLAALWLGAGDALADRIPGLLPHLPGLRDMAPRAAALLGCVSVLHILGLIDDRRPLPAVPKLLLILALATGAVVLTDSRLLTMLDLRLGGTWASIAITVLWIAAVTNAFNFMDNMDGLSGGVAAICTAFFLTTALVSGAGPQGSPQWFVGAMLAVLLGSLLGFLVFNFPFSPRRRMPDGSVSGGASVFMGDGGSLVVGFLLAVLSVRITYVPAASAASNASTPVHLLLSPLIILAVPLYDLVSVVLIRISQGKSPLLGDLQHFSHRLVQHGLSHRAAVMVIFGSTIATGIGAIVLPRVEVWQGILIAAQTLVILGVLAGYEWSRAGDSA